MNNIGIFLHAVAVDIFHTEFLCEHLVYLNGDERIFLAVNVLYLNIELRPVERRLAYTCLIGDFQVVEYLFHNSLRFIPLLGSTYIFIAVIGIPL